MARKENRRKRGRHRGVASRANVDLEAHIASLGLKTVAQYQRWCRDHGLSGAANKTWQERRQERDLAQKDEIASAAESEAEEHARALRLDDLGQYRAWCRQHGLGEALHKSPRQRQKELDLAHRERSQAALKSVRRLTRRPAETITALFNGELDVGTVRTEYLKRIAALAETTPPSERDDLLSLLLHVERHGDLFASGPAIPRLGRQEGNTFIDGLAALARHRAGWVRRLEDWHPDSHGRRRQFSSLARHLLADYDLPAFMDSAWFRGQTEEAAREQAWFVHIGGGQNVRSTDVPVNLTKKMAHAFLEAPDQSTIGEALRWAQVMGQGGDGPLARALNATRLGESFEHEEFWSTVVHWLVRNPMLDPDLVGPIVDYIQSRKFDPQEIALPGGGVRIDDPPEPNFSMKSRSPLKLVGKVEEWHSLLARESRVPATEWEASGISEFDLVEGETGGPQIHWSIRELTTTRELNAEGRSMHHCVRSYAMSCRSGKQAVFSLQLSVAEGGEPAPVPDRIMTIALNPRTRSITQARGRFNATPSGHIPQGQRGRGLGDMYRACLRRSRSVVYQWADREGLHWGRNT